MHQDMPGQTIGDRLECRRVAGGFFQRMVAIWHEDRADISRHIGAHAKDETVEAIGPIMSISSSAAVASRHGRLDGREEIVMGYGPCIPF